MRSFCPTNLSSFKALRPASGVGAWTSRYHAENNEIIIARVFAHFAYFLYPHASVDGCKQQLLMEIRKEQEECLRTADRYSIIDWNADANTRNAQGR
jgi:hypothetical protein